MRRVLRVFKAVVFYLFFCAFCVTVVFLTMRYLAERSGKPGVYTGWRGEIDDALLEARGFLSQTYAKLGTAERESGK